MDSISLPAALPSMRLHRKHVAAHAVLAENGVGAFQRCGDADFEFIGGIGRPDNRGQRNRDR